MSSFPQNPLARTGCWLILLAGLPPSIAADTEPDPLVVEIRAAGIEPSRHGVEKFLEPMRLTPARLAKVRALLADLGNDDFDKREEATTALSAMPHLPRALLKNPGNPDPEVDKRIKQILDDSRRDECEHQLFLVLRLVEEKRLEGLAPLLLELMPQWPEEHLVQGASRAVVASAERRDGKVLRSILARKEAGVARPAAATALAAVFGREAARELEGLLTDADPYVCLASATALLNQENRKPLMPLTRLLDAEQVEVRQAAVGLLREVSAQQIEYVSYDEPERRAEGVAAWRAWVAREGASARLHLPVGVRQASRGRIVAAVFGENVLREIDGVTGKTLFEAPGFTYPWGSHATPEGHRLGVDFTSSYVVEYDARGKEVWRQNTPGRPTGVERLANGRTLLALSDSGKVVEMDRGGKVVWEVNLDGRPTTAQRLANGTTLIALQNAGKVVAVNRKGDVVWELRGLGAPHTAQQLDNGHVLVCDFAGGVKEYDRAGKVVWSKEGVNNPAQAQRLANGNTLISGADGITEFDPRGNQVRHFRMGRCRFFAY
jgi:hypothetical protein